VDNISLEILHANASDQWALAMHLPILILWAKISLETTNESWNFMLHE